MQETGTDLWRAKSLGKKEEMRPSPAYPRDDSELDPDGNVKEEKFNQKE